MVLENIKMTKDLVKTARQQKKLINKQIKEQMKYLREELEEAEFIDTKTGKKTYFTPYQIEFIMKLIGDKEAKIQEIGFGLKRKLEEEIKKR